MDTIKIQSIKDYNARMAKSLLDKSFFLDKIECDIIVDFGCANGELLEFISEFSGDKILVGYDIDADMVNLAFLLLFAFSKELT